MKAPPKETVGPQQGKTATHSKQRGQTSKSADESKARNPFNESAGMAERKANMLLATWCARGTAGCELDPDLFPTPRHRQMAYIVAEATAEGIRTWPDVLPRMMHDDQLRVAFLEAVVECNLPPSAQGGKQLAEDLRQFHIVKHRMELGQQIANRIEAGKDWQDLREQLDQLEAEATKGNQSLLARAYALRFNPDEPPPPDESCMTLGDIPIAARGNLSVIQGKSKVGKSAVVSAIIGAIHRGEYNAQGDTLCVSWMGESTGAIIHLDTEQSRADWHGLVSRSITRSGMPDVSPRLVSIPLVMFARSERMEILNQLLEHEHREKGLIDGVMIDGVADLCKSPNDETEALEIVSQLMALAQKYATPIFCILHENPSTDQGKTRGHLGSELNRKAFANLRIDKDTETSVSTIFGTDMRKREIPREQGFCFGWDSAAGMHTFQGRAAGLKAAQREAQAIAKARAEWERIFELVESQRENQAIPAITTKEAAEAEKEISKKDNLTKPDTMKKRMQKAESLGVLKKYDALRWTITQAGTAGKQREKGTHSRP